MHDGGLWRFEGRKWGVYVVEEGRDVALGVEEEDGA